MINSDHKFFALILILTSLSLFIWSVDASTVESPDPATTARKIDSTYSGIWYDPSRDGEGFTLIISETTAGPTAVVSYYTYDDQKQSVFLVGSESIPAGSTSVSIPIVITKGAKFGDEFKPTDVIRTPAGTLTFRFTSCNNGTVDYDLNPLGNGRLSIVRLAGVESLDCI